MSAKGKGKKSKKVIVAWLYSTGKKENGVPTGCKYLVRRNPKNKTEKLEFMKYDWVLRKRILFKEKKIVYQAN